MNLKLIFRIFGGLNMLTGAGALFATSAMLGSAGMTVTPQLITVGQGFGVTAIALGLVSWRTSDIAGESLPAIWSTFWYRSVITNCAHCISLDDRTSWWTACLH